MDLAAYGSASKDAAKQRVVSVRATAASAGESDNEVERMIRVVHDAAIVEANSGGDAEVGEDEPAAKRQKRGQQHYVWTEARHWIPVWTQERKLEDRRTSADSSARVTVVPLYDRMHVASDDESEDGDREGAQGRYFGSKDERERVKALEERTRADPHDEAAWLELADLVGVR